MTGVGRRLAPRFRSSHVAATPHLRQLQIGGAGHVMLTMKVLNRNQDFPLGCPMRGLRAAMPCLLAAYALPGCMQSAGARPRNNVDAMAYATFAAMAAKGFSPGVGRGDT